MFGRSTAFYEEIEAHFGLIKIILNCVTAKFMPDIASSIASKKLLYDPVQPPTMRPFLRAKKSKVMSIFLSFSGVLDLKLSSVLFTVFLIKFLIEHSTPQTFTGNQDIEVSLLTEFLVEFLTCLILNKFSHIVLKFNKFFSDMLATVLD